MKPITQLFFSLIVITAISSSHVLAADPAKCSPCQARKSVQEAIAQSIKDAAAEALAAGGAYSREQELDIDRDKCGCKTRRDELAQVIEVVDQVEAQTEELLTVAACCDFCAEPGSLGCQGENAFRCNTCQQGLIKISRADAAVEALAAAQAILENQLDQIPEVSRAPREELADPCDPCGPVAVCDINPCSIDAQLKAIRCCCASLTQRVACHANNARKCCKKLTRRIDDVQDVLGDPATATLVDIPLCQSITATDALITATDADVMTWLKSLYSLLYRVHSCICCE